MAIDGINRSSNYPTKEEEELALKQRKRLAENLKNDLEKVERNYQEDLNKNEASRNAQLRQTYLDQAAEVSEKKQIAEERIKDIKASTDSRIQHFESDAEKMTASAKKQFQEKVGSLAKTSQEIEGQKRFMLKQHEELMKKSASDQEIAANSAQQKARRETERLYQNQRRNENMMALEGEENLQKIQTEYADRKRQTQNDNEAKLADMIAERDKNAAQIKGSIDFARRTANDQLDHQRARVETAKANIQSDFEAQSSALNQNNRTLINQQEIQSQKQLHKTRDYYATEFDELRRGQGKKIQQTTFEADRKIMGIENEAKTNEHLIKQAYKYRKQKLSEDSKANIKKITDENELIRNKLETESKRQEKEMRVEKERLYKDQQDTVKSELKYQMDLGQKQVDHVTHSNEKTLKAHGEKQQDPFYRLQDVNAKFEDSGDMITVKIPIPEHEQQAVRLTHQDRSITISGTRRAEVKVSNEEGRTATTNTYQSFSETIPVSGKLDMKKMVRGYLDGNVVIKIPRS